MHIPDGYLSPQTYIPLFGVTVVTLSVAMKKLRMRLSAKQVPFIAMAAAFSFLIQMFNIPVPGGTTGHAVGGAIIAILLGPWTGVLAISLVLIIQAVVFGDGGITAIGANCFNMAIVMPFVSSVVFHLVKGGSRSGKRLKLAAFLAGYLGLSAAAVATGIEFGIQPVIAADPSGRPLYAPYPLSVALPVMAVEHLAFFGIIEGVVTLMLFNYFAMYEPGMVFTEANPSGNAFRKRLWIGLTVLALLTPLGLLLPQWMGADGAWGEWGSDQLAGMIGYLPEGMRHLEDLWKAPVPDYDFPGGSSSIYDQGIAYAVSGFMGIGLIAAVVCGLGRLLMSKSPPVVESEVRGGGMITFSCIERGLARVSSVISTTYVQWETASGSGVFQRLEGRVKLFFLILFIMVVNLKHSFAAQLSVTALTAAISAVALPSRTRFWWKVLFLGFLFGFLIALPSTLNLFVPGEVVLPLASFKKSYSFWIYTVPAQIGFTNRGIETCGLLTLRVVNSVSISLLVLETTPFPALVRSLKMFHVPDIFLIMLTLTYKYIFIFARTVEEMHLARKSRLIDPSGNKDATLWVSGSLAYLYRKTQQRCEDVYKAMRARGFSETVVLEGGRNMVLREYLVVALFSAVAIGIVILL